MHRLAFVILIGFGPLGCGQRPPVESSTPIKYVAGKEVPAKSEYDNRDDGLLVTEAEKVRIANIRAQLRKEGLWSLKPSDRQFAAGWFGRKFLKDDLLYGVMLPQDEYPGHVLAAKMELTPEEEVKLASMDAGRYRYIADVWSKLDNGIKLPDKTIVTLRESWQHDPIGIKVIERYRRSIE